jgi:hypothetical protein
VAARAAQYGFYKTKPNTPFFNRKLVPAKAGIEYRKSKMHKTNPNPTQGTCREVILNASVGSLCAKRTQTRQATMKMQNKAKYCLFNRKSNLENRQCVNQTQSHRYRTFLIVYQAPFSPQLPFSEFWVDRTGRKDYICRSSLSLVGIKSVSRRSG